MLCNVFKTEKKNEQTGFFNRTFFLQGEGLNGRVPIRVVYFGKPVMEPILEEVIDPVSGKPKIDKDGKKVFAAKKDKDGNVLLQVKKDENGNDVLRDDDYRVREELLDMFAAPWGSGEVCKPVTLLSKPRKDGSDELNFFIRLGKNDLPVEVVDFSTETKVDYSYPGNVAKLRYLAGV